MQLKWFGVRPFSLEMGHFSLKNAHFHQKWTEKAKNSRLKRYNCHPPGRNRQIHRLGGFHHTPPGELKADGIEILPKSGGSPPSSLAGV
jgi:hypothetical protein